MQGHDDAPQADVVDWLQDAARRKSVRPAESPEAILRCIEEATGTRFTCSEAVRLYFARLRSEEAARKKAEYKRRRVREFVLVGVLILAAAQYHYTDVNLEILRVPHNVYFVTTPQFDEAPGRINEDRKL